MWALVRSSFRSAVWVPVKSMLEIVALNDREVNVSLKVNVAVPEDAGLAAPVMEFVRTTEGSRAVVRLTVYMTAACPPEVAANNRRGTRRVVRVRCMVVVSLLHGREGVRNHK